MEEKSSNNKPYIITIAVLIAIILGGGVYLLFFQNKNTSAPSENKESSESNIPAPATADITDDTDATKVKKETLLGELECIKDQKPGADYCNIDSEKILNARSGVKYTLTELTKDDSLASDFEKLAKITIDKDDAKKAEIKFDKDMVKKYYGESGINFSIYVTFIREVVSKKIAGFGQGVGV